jgi:hypothetical protein
LWKEGVRVPQADDEAEAQLPHEQAIHPAESELYKLQPLCVEVRVQLFIHAVDELLEFEDHALDAGLREGVVVLDPVLSDGYSVRKRIFVWRSNDLVLENQE